MEKSSQRHVLVIDDIKSKGIEQVIVILKDNPGDDIPTDIVGEANEIISKYSRRIEAGQYRESSKRKGWIFKKR